MNKRDIIKELRKEAEDFVPDVSSSIIDRLGLEPKKANRLSTRKLAFKPMVALLSVFIVVFAMQWINRSKPQPVPNPPLISNTLVTVSINPSFEFEVDDDNIVISYRALNLDAVPIIEDLKTSPNSPLEQVLEELIVLLEAAGYIDPTTGDKRLQIQVVNEEPTKEERIIERIERMKNHHMVMVHRPTEQLRQEAQKEGVSPNKLSLVYKALEIDQTLTKKEALKLTIKALNEIVNRYRKEEIQNFHQSYQKCVLELRHAKMKKSAHYRMVYLEAKNTLSYIRRLNPQKNRAMIVKQLEDWMTDYLVDVDFELSDDTDIKEYIKGLEDELDDRYKTVKEMIDRKHQLQVTTFKEHVKQEIRRGNRDIQFHFDEDFRIDELFSGSFNQEEREVLILVELYQTLIRILEMNDWAQTDDLTKQLENLAGQINERLDSEGIRDRFKERPDIIDWCEGHGHHHHHRMNNQLQHRNQH